MPAQQDSEWFKNWFDSNYYHILYKHRDWKEAEIFIDNLIHFLNLAPSAKILDMPCGKGRHSIYLNKKGFEVTGIDLSGQSINHAKEYANTTLSFFVHDMRNVFKKNYFDLVLNLFTSIGYFDTEEENKHVIAAAADSLKNGGVFVIDFMNASRVKKELIAHESKSIDNVHFDIKKRIENKFVLKAVELTDGTKTCSFQEKVQLLTLADFENYLKAGGLKIKHLLGDYLLNPFDENTSERLIIISEKI